MADRTDNVRLFQEKEMIRLYNQDSKSRNIGNMHRSTCNPIHPTSADEQIWRHSKQVIEDPNRISR